MLSSVPMNQADVPKKLMSESNFNLAVAQAIALIKSYSFDTNGKTAETLVHKWLSSYQGNWVRLAAIEALYLGRYKAISIEQIMEVWSRIGMPNIHFEGEFERLICSKLPQHLIVSDSSSNQGQNSEFGNLLTNTNSESNSQIEILLPDHKYQQPPKKLSEVKNILKQGKRETGSPGDKGDAISGECLAADSLFSVSEEQNQSLDNYNSPCNSTTITNFNPILDRSSFFDKLKSLAVNSDRLKVNH